MKKILFILPLLMATMFLLGCSAPDEVSIHKEYPVEVVSGDMFNFTVFIDNQDSKAHELRSIDIGHNFLRGIMIIETYPATVEEYDAFGEHIFEFRTDVQEESEKAVVFKAKALYPGDYSGNLDVCIDGDAKCIFNHIRIIVGEPDES